MNKLLSKFLWVFAIIPWLIILFFILTRNKPADMVAKAQYSALEQRYNDTLQEYHKFRQWSDSILDVTASYAVQSSEQLQSSHAALEDAGASVNYLLRRLDSAAIEKQNNSWISVSPNYKDACDSLRRANLTLNYRIIQYEQDTQAQADALAYESHIRDSIIEQERAFNAKFKGIADNAMVENKTIQKSAVSKNQVYAGFGAIGSQYSPFAGGQINLSLKTKSDQIYELTGAFIQSTWYVGLGTKFKLHL